MRINRNAAANYTSRLWTGLATFLFVPVYLRLLGPEAFGLVMFSASVMGVVFVLDMGMSNTFAREVALKRDAYGLAVLLRSLEWVYFCLIALVLLFATVASGLIADYWLNTGSLPFVEVRLSVALMLVSASLQVMMALYIGGLLGSDRHVKAAGYQIGFSILRSGLVIIPIYFWPRVDLFFIWQLIASVVCLFLLRRSMWRLIRSPSRPNFSPKALRAVGRFAGGMFGIALISAINTQSDKLVASKVFALEQFGSYSIASLIGQVPSMLALPLAITVLPRLTGYIGRADRQNLLAIYMRYSFMISAVSYTGAVGVFMGAGPLLSLVTGAEPPPDLILVTRFLAVGGGLLASQYMPYHLAVASGHTRTNLIFGAFSAVVMPVAMFYGATRFGVVGAAVPWVAMNAAAAVFLASRIMPRFLGPHLAEWFWKANLLPLVVSIIVVVPAAVIVGSFEGGIIGLVALGCLCALAITINAWILVRSNLYGNQPDSKADPTT